MSDAPLGISRDDLKNALKSSAGIYAVAAEKLGCTRQNVSQRVRDDQELLAFCAEIEQSITDAAQANVVSAMQERQPNGKPTKEALKQSNWWLDRMGKSRGFSTRAELTGPDGQALAPPTLTVNVQYVEATAEDASTRDHAIGQQPQARVPEVPRVSRSRWQLPVV